MFENTEPWDKSVPIDLIPAIKHLREQFEEAHWKCGQVTEIFCFSQLHKIIADEKQYEYLKPFLQLKRMVGVAAEHRWQHMHDQGTLPATFRSYYDLYLEGTGVQIVSRPLRI